MTEREIFAAALNLHHATERAAYLDQACAGDAALRQRVESLLADHDQLGSFMEVPSVVATQEPISERPGTQIGPYKLMEQIGEGGMGLVFVAEQHQPVRRKVALKVIRPGMDTRDVIARFEAERQALALMDHPNIARVLDAGATATGRPFFVMELVKGVPITQYCDENRLTPRQRLELFADVCHAVQHAHQKGIIHRDIKPNNVLVASHDGTAVVKVIDFGVAKAIGQQLTERTIYTAMTQMVGTPLYMSPEQAGMSSLDIDTRSDIYSLGVLLYELLTGTTPFDRERLKQAAFDEVRRILREEDPPKPSTRISTTDAAPSIAACRHTEPAKLAKLVRGDLDWIVMKALEKDRARRYQTASGFAADVLHYLADEPVTACPPSAAYRLRKFARRNKAVLAIATAAALGVSIVIGSIGWTVRDRAAREEEAIRERSARQIAIAREVSLALEEAERLQEQGNWLEALSAAKRAEGLLAGGASNELRDRVRQHRKDIEMILRLDEIRLLLSEWNVSKFNYAGADREYTTAFDDYGIDVAGLPAEQSVARIRNRPAMAMALVHALDHWAAARSGVNDAPGKLALLGVAQDADPDRWRRDVRDARMRGDGDKLAALAFSQDLSRLSPANIHFLARALGACGRAESEIDILRRAQRQYPNDFWISYDLANVLKSKGPTYHDEAISYYRAALAARPNCNAAFNDLGICLYEQNKLEDAVACYRRAIEIDPNHAPAHGNIGLVLLKQGKADEALVWVRKAIELDPNNANSHNSMGMAWHDLREYEAAIASYCRAIEIIPEYANAHANLGHTFKELNRFDDAIDYFHKAIEIDPKHVGAHNGMGNVFLEQKKLEEAIAWYSKAIVIDPRKVNAYYNIGRLHWHNGNNHEAIIWYRKAIELAPTMSQPREGLALALQNLSWNLINSPDPKLRDREQALEAILEAVALTPHSALAWQYAGWIHLRAGNWPASIEALEKSCQLQAGGTGDAAQWIALALAHARLAKNDNLTAQERDHHTREARRRYEEASKLIDAKWSARPADYFNQAQWDFREEFRALMNSNEDNE